MNTKKWAMLAVIAISLAAMPARAEHDSKMHDKTQQEKTMGGEKKEMSPEKFAEIKAKMLEHMEQRQACVRAAQSPQDLGKCHKQHKQGMMKHHEGKSDGNGNSHE